MAAQKDPDRLADFLLRVQERHAKTGHTVTYPDHRSCWFCITGEAMEIAQERDTLRAEVEKIKAALHSIARLLTAYYRARETPQNAVRTVDAISDVITTEDTSTT